MQDPVACPKEGGAQGTKIFPDKYPPRGWSISLGPMVYCGCAHSKSFGISEGYQWLNDHSIKFRCAICDKNQCTVCDGVLRVAKGERDEMKKKYADQIEKADKQKAQGRPVKPITDAADGSAAVALPPPTASASTAVIEGEQ
eukprot:gb/GEZN01025460.1/.p1 GENE.gb/GEZN01025460.1/~~gb/GEZN01025460.1/.p1  ORF type:complete len:142 (-),score=11.83 gb/GEZN01025460.1/:86-511(-)